MIYLSLILQLQNHHQTHQTAISLSGTWETTEQRLNTDPPPLPAECRQRVCPANVGLIPKYLKPFQAVRGDNGKQIYVCNYCQGEFRGHNSIVYHTRRHIGDYPYRCGTCGYAEVSKCALNQHLLNHRHQGAILLRYTRDPNQTMDQVARDIHNSITNNNERQQAERQPEMKRRKLGNERTNNEFSVGADYAGTTIYKCETCPHVSLLTI